MARGGSALANRQATTSGGAYDSPKEALRALQVCYDEWTGALGNRGVELTYAVIAANWAAFGTIDQAAQNWWSVSSLAIAVLFLVLNLGLTQSIAGQVAKRFRDAEKDPRAWEAEFTRTCGTDDPFPFTNRINATSTILRLLRTWLPTLAGALFVVGLVRPSEGVALVVNAAPSGILP